MGKGNYIQSVERKENGEESEWLVSVKSFGSTHMEDFLTN